MSDFDISVLENRKLMKQKWQRSQNLDLNPTHVVCSVGLTEEPFLSKMWTIFHVFSQNKYLIS